MKLENVFFILVKSWKKLFLGSFIAAVVTLLLALLVLPISYNTQAVLMPPEGTSGSSFASMLGLGDAASLIGMGKSEESQMYAEILKSRSVKKAVIERSELLSYYDEEDWRRAAKSLSGDVLITVTKEGMINISSTFKTPYFSRFTEWPDSINRFSAKITNLFVTCLDSVQQHKLNTKARNSRMYLESEIENTKSEMDKAQDKLLEFKKNNKAISLDDQVKVAIDNAAQIKSEILQKEILLKTYEINMGKSSKTYQNELQKLTVLRDKYSELTDETNGDDKNYLPVFSTIPDLQLELAVMMREVRILNEVYIFLQKQYYFEKLQENKDVPTVEVLDEAIPAYKAKSPRLLWHPFLAGVFTFLILSLILVLLEIKKDYYKKRNGELA